MTTSDNTGKKAGGPCESPAIRTIRLLHLALHLGNTLLNLRFDGFEIEARALLQRRKLDECHRFLGNHLLQEDEAPELVDVEVRHIVCGTHVAFPNHLSLEGIEPEVGEQWHVQMHCAARPAVGLVNQTELPVVNAHRAQGPLGKIEDFVPGGPPLAGKQVQLIVAVEVNLVGRAVQVLALPGFLRG